MIIPVILAGGSGTRLWPLSREQYPKQFKELAGESSLFQQSVARGASLSSVPPIVIANQEHRFLVAEQLRQMGSTASILLEPVGRNTAPAIALAAFHAIADYRVRDTGEDVPALLVLAADHVIKDDAAFHEAVKALEPAVRAGRFGTFGIVPTEPSTGYGYIQASAQQSGLLDVTQFVEKPDSNTAQSYIATGNYFWNSGMFMIRADRYLEELKRFQPDMYTACEDAMANTKVDLDFIRIDAAAFESCPADSVDYAIMEPLCSAGDDTVVVMAPLDAGWNDIGSWSALWDIADKCEDGNAILRGGSDSVTTILNSTRNSLVCTSDRLVATLGVDDLVIVDTKDALLVAHRECAQDVKAIVAQIQEQGGAEHKSHREVYRPWGRYDSVDASSGASGTHYLVKRITVKPGGKLSVQMHRRRAEHWIVVSGTAKVTKGDATFLVHENESTFIPIGQVHSLENPGEFDLEIIEVQSGVYIGEDDIVRFEDMYGRA